MKVLEAKMRGAYSAIYIVNVVFQSVITLLMHIGGGLLLAWLLVEKCGLPSWLYAITILVGVITGFFSMIKFILSTMNALNHIEKSQKSKRRKNGQNNEK